jgi:flavin-dependent dehydrogenase
MKMTDAGLDKPIDVAIIGGGPAGTTAATLLKKYNPDLCVVILEKEKFPRDHIGESQLPSIGPILHEMGVWDKVEAAGFPIKIGASFTWGRDHDRWDLDFYPIEEFRDEPRPAKYEGQRLQTAFQIDRSIFDDILLRHAESMGVIVREQTKVKEVLVDGDRIAGLRIDESETVQARHYIDASGTVSIVRRAFDLEVDIAKELRNIAIWDYWQNADWAIEIGTGATRIQVRSLAYGWIWFIPLGATRTSIGLVCPADYYKQSGKSAADLYHEALKSQTEIYSLLANAKPEGKLQTTKDWSQLTERIVGENWFIAGEAAGFADPILSAGMSLAHSSGRDAAYTILELDRGEHDPSWLRSRYDERNRSNIAQHIRFAEYWYSANSCFTELQEQCQRIARSAGLKLSPKQAWHWISQGGFTNEFLGNPSVGSFDVSTTRQLINLFDPKGRDEAYLCNGYNVFKLNLRGAKKIKVGVLAEGRIEMIDCYERGGRRLPLHGYYGAMVQALERSSDITEVIPAIQRSLKAQHPTADQVRLDLLTFRYLQALEVMVHELWVKPSLNKKKPPLLVHNRDSRYVRRSDRAREIIDEGGAKSPIKWNIE